MKKIITFLLLILVTQIHAQEMKFGKVTKVDLKEKFHPIDATSNAAYLCKYRTTRYDYNQEDGFMVVTKIHERIKIYNKEGLSYANKLISYYNPETGTEQKISGIKGYTFNLDNGEIVKEKLSNSQVFDQKVSKFWNQKKIAMPAVKVGSVIDLKYEKRSPYTRDIDDVQFQFAIPVKDYFTSIQIPEYYVFKHKSKGFYSIAPEKTYTNKSINFINRNRSTNAYVTGNSTSYSKVDYKAESNTFKAENITALKNNEPYIGDIDNYRGGLSYELSYVKFPNSVPEYYTTTWKDVSTKIYKNSYFGTELNKTNYFKKDLAIVIANTNNEYEKLAKVLNFVKTKVKWNNYYSKYTDLGVKKAYKEGIGNVADINLMLTAMLRASGLNANPVLVSSKNNGIPLFPTSNGFNYVISMIEFEDGTYALLDATEPYSIPNILPKRALNWKGRKVLEDGSSSWVTLISKKHAIEDQKIYVKITPENTIEGLARSVFKNTEALRYRLKNNKLNEETVITNLEEKYGIEINDFKVLNEKNLGKPIATSVKFTKDDILEEIGNKLYINPLLHLSKKENPFKTEDRKFPVDFITPWQDKNTISLTLPEGYKVEFLPKNMAIGLPENLGVFKFIISQKGDKINVQSLIQINEALISPIHYQELKGFYNEVVLKQSEKIILVKE